MLPVHVLKNLGGLHTAGFVSFETLHLAACACNENSSLTDVLYHLLYFKTKVLN